MTTLHRFKLHLFAILGFLILFTSGPGHTSTENDPLLNSSDDIQRNIEEHRVKIQRLQRGIREQQDQTQETVKRENNILQELEDIEIRLQKQLSKVRTLEEQVQAQHDLIRAKEEEIDTLVKDRDRVLEHLKKRTSAYYKMGKVGFLNVTFSSKSLPELLKFHDSFQTLIAYDQAVMSRYRKQIVELERARDAYALEKELLQEFAKNAQQESHEIDLIKIEKEELLSHIRSQKHLHEQAIKELEDASEMLSSALIELKTKEHDLAKTFERSKGSLPAPLRGEIVTLFAQEKANKLGILRKSSGISIKAPDGSKVQAIADGTVIFSGYLRGYGNTIIIHHGFQYYTVTSRIDDILLKPGSTVKTGDHIGQLSDTATLIDEGLYFEIRHGKTSQDPLQWLDVKNLQPKKPKTTLSQKG